jgi:hypothetical protein
MGILSRLFRLSNMYQQREVGKFLVVRLVLAVMLIVLGLPGTAYAEETAEQSTSQESDTVTICHKLGTRAEKTLAVPLEDLAGHFSHGDGMGACIAGGAVYVISGGTDQEAGIFVDDILRVFLNGVLIFEGSQGGRCCTALAPVRFVATTGDTLQVQAQDANDCYSLEALWLQKADGGSLIQLTEDIFGPNCGSEPPEQIFFDQTFTLP